MNKQLFLIKLFLGIGLSLILFRVHVFLSSKFENVTWLFPFYFLLIGFCGEIVDLLHRKKVSWAFERPSDKLLFLVSIAVPTISACWILMIGAPNSMLVFALVVFFLCDFCSYQLGSLELKEKTIYFRVKKFFS